MVELCPLIPQKCVQSRCLPAELYNKLSVSLFRVSVEPGGIEPPTSLRARQAILSQLSYGPIV